MFNFSIKTRFGVPNRVFIFMQNKTITDNNLFKKTKLENDFVQKNGFCKNETLY